MIPFWSNSLTDLRAIFKSLSEDNKGLSFFFDWDPGPNMSTESGEWGHCSRILGLTTF